MHPLPLNITCTQGPRNLSKRRGTSDGGRQSHMYRVIWPTTNTRKKLEMNEEAVLQKGHRLLEEPRVIHLVNSPLAVIRSVRSSTICGHHRPVDFLEDQCTIQRSLLPAPATFFTARNTGKAQDVQMDCRVQMVQEPRLQMLIKCVQKPDNATTTHQRIAHKQPAFQNQSGIQNPTVVQKTPNSRHPSNSWESSYGASQNHTQRLDDVETDCRPTDLQYSAEMKINCEKLCESNKQPIKYRSSPSCQKIHCKITVGEFKFTTVI